MPTQARFTFSLAPKTVEGNIEYIAETAAADCKKRLLVIVLLIGHLFVHTGKLIRIFRPFRGLFYVLDAFNQQNIAIFVFFGWKYSRGYAELAGFAGY